MKKYLYLFLTVLLFGCSENKDTNIIDKEFQLNEQYFVGRRTSDKLANVYTKEIKSGLFGKDTIRHYLLNNWTNIEYWDGKGGVLVFKEFNKASNDGLEIPLSDIKNLTDSYLIERQEKAIEEKIKYDKENFDVLTCSDQQIWDFIQGDWHGWDHPIGGMDVYYKLNISGKKIIASQYVYTEGYSDRYSNWDNAPFSQFLDCNFSGSIERKTSSSILDINSRLDVKQEEGRAYILLDNSCNEEFKLFLGNPARTYKDEKKDLKVELKAETVGWNAVFARGKNFSD